ncbi:MAG TPA: sensor histidine kinase [Clostridiaceae bacterium]|nr:sensor histidine kinase [Clostridiaceae bacterium]
MKSFFERTILQLFKTNSIRSKLKISFLLIILIVLIPSIMSITFSSILTVRYGKLIHNVDDANSLNKIVKFEITSEIWDIVSGKKEFTEGEQYSIIENIYERLNVLARNASTKENRQLIEVARRAMSTLENYVDRLGQQIEDNLPVVENEKLLEEIRGVSVLVYDVIQEFIFSEIEAIARVNDSLQRSGTILTILEITIFILVAVFAVYTVTSVAENISQPILKLQNLSVQIAEGDLEARVDPLDVEELKGLAQSLNIMAGRIRDLIDENIRKVKNLQKSEMKALQAQIAPHFLYNTFDTIIWLAEAGRNEDVINVAMAFSNFFRISLSKGNDWITVRQEVEHVKSYLTIQRVRYESILDFSIEVEEEMMEHTMLKLILQPLVENALYHGIKFRRNRGGLITIKGWLKNKEICFSVEDNGVGIQPDRLQLIRSRLENGDSADEVGYGLFNVNKRIQLYYETTKGLVLESTPGQGTTVSFRLPLRSEQNV